MRRHPTQGVKGAKPRLRKVHNADDAVVENLNREYLTHRNAQMKARAEMAAREAALRDGTLHESKRCEQIVGHYLTLMRQRLLWIPARVRAQWRQPDLTEFVRDEIYSALTELSELPEAVATGRVTDYVIDPIMPNGGDGNGNGDAVEPVDKSTVSTIHLNPPMKKNPVLLVFSHALLCFALTPVLAQTPTPAPTATLAPTPVATPITPLRDRLTQVLPDRRVTFRLLAPKANAVEVVIGIKAGVYEPEAATTAQMTKDTNGLWSATLGPLEPNLYEYQFNLDGCKIADPGNDMPRPRRQIDTSLLLVPGTPPDFLDVQNGAHGTMRDETYYSTTLGKNRQILVYTPPSYNRSHAALPVLYLYHGFGNTRYSWVTEGRLAQILDNLLAEGKTVPMVVVVPEAHALPPEDIVGADRSPYLAKNQQAVDEELFHDIIPFIEAHYNISDNPRRRAIAGLSMGGLQSIETGIVHLGYFRWIGAFSPGNMRPAALSEEFENALRDPDKINKNLLLFDIVIGADDKMVGEDVTKFEDQLKQANVEHTYTVLPGETHSMFVWRPALANFLQEIFKE
jgi:enterochelin esterase-like enzyme